MNKFRFTLNMLAVATFIFAFASFTQAQATRTWVSGVGDDVNPCSRTAPCKTFAGAISKTAINGEIDCLDPGGFGTVTITKSIIIDGTTGSGFGSILAAGTNGVNVNDSATGTPNTIIVRLRNLSINGAGTGLEGIRFTSGKALYVEHCTVYNFKAGNGNGIGVALTGGTGQQLSVKDSLFSENSNDGVRLSETGGSLITAFFDNSRFERNGQNGIELLSISNASIRNSSFVNNTTNGVKIGDGNSTATLENSYLTASNSGVLAAAGNARVRGNHITNNNNGANCSGGGTISSYGDNAIFGNTTNILICTDPLPPIQKK